MRIVIDLKRDAVADVVLNQLWRYSQLQSSFGANMLALNGGRPEQMTLRDMISAFCAFREEVVTRRTKYLLNRARPARTYWLVSRLRSPTLTMSSRSFAVPRRPPRRVSS